jgi:hypothetical protein
MAAPTPPQRMVAPLTAADRMLAADRMGVANTTNE